VSLQVSGRTQALLEHRLHLTSLPPADAAAALLLRGLMELCIYPPQPPEGGDDGGDDGAGGADSNGAAGPSADGESGAESGVGGGTGRLPMSWSCTDEAILQVPTSRIWSVCCSCWRCTTLTSSAMPSLPRPALSPARRHAPYACRC